MDTSGTHVWLHRIVVALYIVVTFQLGIILVRIPWGSAWTDNTLFSAYPQIRHYLETNFVRGAISGLGLLNLWIGVRETSRLIRSARGGTAT